MINVKIFEFSRSGKRVAESGQKTDLGLSKKNHLLSPKHVSCVFKILDTSIFLGLNLVQEQSEKCGRKNMFHVAGKVRDLARGIIVDGMGLTNTLRYLKFSEGIEDAPVVTRTRIELRRLSFYDSNEQSDAPNQYFKSN